MWCKEWGGDMYFSHGSVNSKGVAILFPPNVDIEINRIESDDGRFLAIDMLLEKTHILLINIYAPTKDKENDQVAFLEKLNVFLEQHQDMSIFLGGDLNTYLNPELDKKGGDMINSTKYSILVNCLMDEFNLVDSFRVVNPDTKRYTWRGMTKHGLVQSRLDYCLVSSHMLGNLEDVSIQPSIRSDHSMVSVGFQLESRFSKGRGFWKFNSSLLSDKEYVSNIKEVINSCKDKYSYLENKGNMWDLIKCEIRSKTISYTAWRTKKHNHDVELLRKEIDVLESNHVTLAQNIDLYNVKKTLLEDLVQHEAHGIQIRSRATYIEDNEKCSKYFMQLEKRNYLQKGIRVLQTDNGVIREQKDILKEQVTYYKNLYSTRNSNVCNVGKCSFFDTEFPQLGENDKETCDGEVTIEELGYALKQLSNNKSPGSDGFTPEFYKFFWNDLKEIFFETVQFIYENGILSIDQRRSLLTLLPKPGKDIRQLKNWRPLSLLNTDYKIMAKFLSIRLQNVIGPLVSEDQVGYIKGRQLGEHCRKILDIFEYSEIIDDPGIALFLDFEKAFDTVSREFLYVVLKKFNFGPSFIKWITILYTQSLCIVTNNGHASEAFVTNRGIRQGCPISSLLFVLVAEVVSIFIRSDNNIRGLNFNNVTMTIAQMADDTTLFLRDIDSVKYVLDVLRHFQKCAGLKLNRDKTKAIQLGIVTKQIVNKFGLNWGADKVSVTGVMVGKDIDMLTKSLLHEKVLKISNLLNIWKARQLTIKGKITLLKTKVMPIFLYIGSIVYVPEDVLIEIEKLFYDFIWPKGKHHVKKDVLIQDIEEGGLRMPDVTSMLKALKLKWLNRLCSKQTSFTSFAKSLMGKSNLNEFLYYKCDVKYLSMPSFYRQFFHYWYELHSRPPEGITEILDEFLWFNKRILINSKPVFYQQWNDSGVKRVRDVIKQNGLFYTPDQLLVEYGMNVDIMMYNSLKSAIPKVWKQHIRKTKIPLHSQAEGRDLLVKIGDTKCLKNVFNLTCKQFYQEFVNMKYVRPTALYKWEEMYYFADFDWKILYKIPCKVARETDLHSLQYQLINRYTPCNVNLQLWGKEMSDQCPRCGHIDTIEHYFFECIDNRTFWSELSTFIQTTYEVNIELHLLDVLFGIPFDDVLFTIINFCVLYGKKYIYRCRINDDNVNTKIFVKKLRNRLEIEIQLLCVDDIKRNMFELLYEKLDYPLNA